MKEKQIINLEHLKRYLKKCKHQVSDDRTTFTIKNEYIGYLGIHPVESIVISDDLVKIFAWEFHGDFEIVEIDGHKCITGNEYHGTENFLTIIKKELLDEYSVV
jgi:hypothetical protein